MKISPGSAQYRNAWRSRLVLVILAATGSAVAGAEPPPAIADSGFQNLPTLDADELQTLRGGFEFAGLKFDFAAQIRTFLDGRLALESFITYTEAGTLSQHHPLPVPNAAMQSTPTSTAAVTGQATAPVPVPVTDVGESVQLLGAGQGPTPAQLNLNGIDLAGLKDAVGIMINDRKGATIALHEATRERITSMVVNQASGRDIRQELDVSVTVNNFQQFRDSIRSTILNSRLNATPR